MKTMIAALAVFLLAVLGMALGVIFGKRCIRGSCGGISNLRDGSGRPLCDHCPSRNAETTDEPGNSDAASRLTS